MRKALVFSIGLHVLAFGISRTAIVRSAAAAPVLADAQDHWTGTTPFLPGEVYDVSSDVESTGVQAAPAAAPVAPPAPPPVAPPVAPPVTPIAVAATGEAARPPQARPRPSASASDRASAVDRASAARPKRAASSAGAGDASSSGAPAAGGSGRHFGAEGPASVRDVGYAFTRAIPIGNKTDPAWAAAPLGDAGKLEVVMHVDATGHITSFEPRGSSRPAGLVSLVRRTLPAIDGGTFAVRDGAVGEGTQVLELRAVVTDGPPPEVGQNLENYLGSQAVRGGGKAWIQHVSGRWVAVTVKTRKDKR